MKYATFYHDAVEAENRLKLSDCSCRRQSSVCCVVLCCILLSCAVPCRAVPCRAVPCRAVPCRAVPCRAVPCRAVPCRAVPCCVVTVPFAYFTFGPLFAFTYSYCGSNKVVETKTKTKKLLRCANNSTYIVMNTIHKANVAIGKIH